MNLPKFLARGMAFTSMVAMTLSANSQVLITEIADPGNSASSRYVELYNIGATTIDLTGWDLELYANTNTTVTNHNVLSGNLAPGDYYIVAQDAGTYMSTFGSAPDLDGNVNANGDDNFQLRDGGGVLIDEFGVVGEDGTGTCHEFEDGRAERAATVLGPNPAWDEAEWNVSADSGPFTCTNHMNIGSGGLSAPADYDPRFWIGSGAVACGFTLGSISAVCDNINPGPGDTYTLSIPYTGIDAGVTVVNNGTSGTIAGDDPALVSNGTITITGIDEADNYDVSFTAPCDNLSVSGNAPTCDPLPALVINEINADPDATLGDANGDGNVSTTQDEFVEIVNNDVVDVDISGFTISDAGSVRHTFDPGTIIPAGCAIVVFGGGTPTGTFGGALTAVSSSGSLSMNNGGDDVVLANSTGTTITEVLSYSNGGNNNSITRDPDISGASFVEHTTATGSGGSLFSPGTQIDGSSFSGCSVPACNISFQLENAVCVTSNPGPGDTYDLSIPYVGSQAGITVINNSGSGSIGGDDPASVANGTIVISGIDEANGYDVALSAPCGAVTLSGSAPNCDIAYTLVINELDYDQPGSDVAEFIEIMNVGVAAVDLAGVQIELANGNGGGASVYNTITLPSFSLAAGDYYVICKDGGLTPNCDQVEAGLSMQNGGPDALAMKNPSGIIIDAISYEGDAAAPYIEGSGVGLEDSGSSGNDESGISRFPDGGDTDMNNVDWSARCITPGLANEAQNSFCVCEPPTVGISTSCPDDFNFNIVVNVTSLGSSAAVDILDDQFVAFEFGVGIGTYTIGPYPNNTVVELSVFHDSFTQCDVVFSGVTEDCTPAGPCLDNEVTLDITTDDYPNEIIWEIFPAGSSTAACSGGPYFTNFSQFSESCCLPDGDYDLVFSDAFGDGINPGGGFSLSNSAGDMIIGAEGVVIPGGSANNYGQSFSVPIGAVKLHHYFCDKRDYLISDFIVAELDPAVTAEYGVGVQNDDGYQFWFFDVYSGYSRRIFLSHANPAQGTSPGPGAAAHVRFNNMVSIPIPSTTLLNCRVRPRVNGVNGAFGPSCFVMVDPSAAACPSTHLVDDPASPFFSCGVNKVFLGSDKIRAQPIAGANKYQFRFENVSEGYLRHIAFPSYTCVLKWYTLPLSVGVTYDVQVRASFDNGGSWCPFGAACQVTITGVPAQSTARMSFVENGEFTVWPNPSLGQALNLSVSGIDDESEVLFELFDARGQLVLSKRIAQASGSVTTSLEGSESLPAGVYMVRSSFGGNYSAQQVIIQH